MMHLLPNHMDDLILALIATGIMMPVRYAVLWIRVNVINRLRRPTDAN